MYCLVTGGAGFIGSHTVDALLERGYRIRILDNLSYSVHLGKKPGYLSKDVEFIEGDVCNENDLVKALHGIDVVFHFAAYQDNLLKFSKLFQTNCVGTALLYEVIVQKKLDIKKIIIASSQAVYGEGKYRCARCNRIKYPGTRSVTQLENQNWDIYCDECGYPLQSMWTNENRVNPQNNFAITKYTQELIGLNLGKRYGIPTCCLRYSNVEGPRQSVNNLYSGVCRLFCLSQYFDKIPSIYEDGKQLRDFVNIHDVVNANLVALHSPKSDYRVFNVGGGKSYSVLQLSEIVTDIFGKNISPQIVNEFRIGDIRSIFSDISKLKELGWRPQYSPRESIEQYMQWLDTYDNIKDFSDEIKQQMIESNVIRRVKVKNNDNYKKTGNIINQKHSRVASRVLHRY